MLSFQLVLKYAAVGIYPALDYFSIDADHGMISVKQGLQSDPYNSLMFTVSMVY